MHWPNSENASNTVELLHIQHRIIMHWPNSENASNTVVNCYTYNIELLCIGQTLRMQVIQ